MQEVSQGTWGVPLTDLLLMTRSAGFLVFIFILLRTDSSLVSYIPTTVSPTPTPLSSLLPSPPQPFPLYFFIKNEEASKRSQSNRTKQDTGWEGERFSSLVAYQPQGWFYSQGPGSSHEMLSRVTCGRILWRQCFKLVLSRRKIASNSSIESIHFHHLLNHWLHLIIFFNRTPRGAFI